MYTQQSKTFSIFQLYFFLHLLRMLDLYMYIIIPREFQTNNTSTMNCSHSLVMEVHSMMNVRHRLHDIVDTYAVLHFLELFA